MDHVSCECGFDVPVPVDATECVCPQCQAVLKLGGEAAELDLPPTNVGSPAPSTSVLVLAQSSGSDVEDSSEAHLQPTVVPNSSFPDSAPVALSPPPQFGDYEIIEEIARGGMGVVYLARQSSLKRTVALKVIRSGSLAGEAEIHRFRLEAEAAARLNHPGIVPVYDFGEHGGQPYFSMAFIDGPNLSAELADGPMQPRRAAVILEKIATAMEYAHRQGVIHRDLKPGNVLLEDGENPKVTDFGLAKSAESDSDVTGTGQVLGTASFMPPEQAAGDGKLVGPLADVYSLGAILYYLLTGRPPFQAASVMDTLIQVLNIEPVSPRRLNPQIPVDLETICLKCLEKAPAKRYQSSEELAADLMRFVAGNPIMARPTGKAARFGKWCKRRPAVAALSFLAITLLVTGAGVSAHFGMNANEQAEHAITAREAAEEARREALIQSARLALRRGTEFCQRGELRLGLVWLAQSLEAAPADAEHLQQVIRRNIGLWFQKLDYVLWNRGEPTMDQAKFAGLNMATGQLSVGPAQLKYRSFREDEGGFRVEVDAPLMPPADPDVMWFSKDNIINESGTLIVLHTDNDMRTGASRFPVPGGEIIYSKSPIRLPNLTPEGLSVHRYDEFMYLYDHRAEVHSGDPLVFKSRVMQIAQDRSASRVAILTKKGAIEVWRVADGKFAEPLLERSVPPPAYPMRLTMSQDGTAVAYVDQAMNVRVWDVETQKLVDEFTVQRSELEFHPSNGTLLFIQDGLCRRDFRRQTTTDVIEKNAWRVPRYSRNGEFMYAPNGWHVWKKMPPVSDVEEIDPLPIERLAREIDDWRLIAARDDSGLSRMYDARTFKPVGRHLPVEGKITHSSFSKNGRWLVTGTDRGSIQLWNADTSMPVGPPWQVHPVTNVCFTEDHAAILAHCRDGETGQYVRIALPAVDADPSRVRLWLTLAAGVTIDETGVPQDLDVAALQEVHRQLMDAGGPPKSYRESTPPLSVWDSIIVAGEKQEAHVPAFAADPHPPLLDGQEFEDVSFFADGERMVAQTKTEVSIQQVFPRRVDSRMERSKPKSGWIHIWDNAADGTFCLFTNDRSLEKPTYGEVFDANCRRLYEFNNFSAGRYVGHPPGILFPGGREFLLYYDKPLDEIGHADLSQRGGHYQFQFIDAENRALRPFRLHWTGPYVRASADGQWLASASSAGAVYLDHIHDPKLSKSFPRHQSWNSGLGFSGDNRVLVSTGGDGARVIDVETGKQIGGFKLHDSGVRRLAVNYDGRIVAIAQRDESISIWSTETEARLAIYLKLSGQDWTFSRMGLSRDGTRLFTFDTAKHSLQVWDLSAITGPARAENRVRHRP